MTIAGILVCDYDTETGIFTPRSAASDIDNPSWVATHPSLPALYAVSESGDPRGGTIRSYLRDLESGALVYAGTVESGGQGPCHVSVRGDGRFAFAANYNSGSVSSYRVDAEGVLEGPVSTIQHTGSSVHETRQSAAHAHQALSDPSGRFLLVPDLGTDRIEVYEVDGQTGALRAGDLFISLEPGSGPRHADFHPDAACVYVVNELASTIAVLPWPPAGSLQTISTLPADFRGDSTAAAIRVHPSGRFVYASNRGHDSVAMYRVGPDYRLETVGWESSRGRTPREINLSPDGRFLFVANQDSDAIATFRIDGSSGRPGFLRMTEAPRPVCLRFV